MRFFQFLRTVVATHLDRLAADFDLDETRIQFAVASRARFSSHQISLLEYPKCGRDQ